MYNNFVIVMKGAQFDKIITLDNESKVKEAFFNECAENVPDWDSYTDDDKEFVFVSGYEYFENGKVVIVRNELEKVA